MGPVHVYSVFCSFYLHVDPSLFSRSRIASCLSFVLAMCSYSFLSACSPDRFAIPIFLSFSSYLSLSFLALFLHPMSTHACKSIGGLLPQLGRPNVCERMLYFSLCFTNMDGYWHLCVLGLPKGVWSRVSCGDVL